jgi:hypothetical protein
VDRDRLGQQLERLRRRDVDSDDVAGADPGPGLGRDRPVDRDAAVVDQPLDLRPRQLAVARGDERVEPLAAGGGVDDVLAAPGGRGGGVGRLPRGVVVLCYQIFDLTCPFDLTSTSTIARS